MTASLVRTRWRAEWRYLHCQLLRVDGTVVVDVSVPALRDRNTGCSLHASAISSLATSQLSLQNASTIIRVSLNSSDNVLRFYINQRLTPLSWHRLKHSDDFLKTAAFTQVHEQRNITSKIAKIFCNCELYSDGYMSSLGFWRSAIFWPPILLSVFPSDFNEAVSVWGQCHINWAKVKAEAKPKI